MSDFDSNGNMVMPIDLGLDTIPKPKDFEIARHGPRRLVKLVPIPGSAGPAIWTSPKASFTEIDGQPKLAYTCVVLVAKEPPQTVRVFVPKDFYDKLHDIPVEW